MYTIFVFIYLFIYLFIHVYYIAILFEAFQFQCHVFGGFGVQSCCLTPFFVGRLSLWGTNFNTVLHTVFGGYPSNS